MKKEETKKEPVYVPLVRISRRVADHMVGKLSVVLKLPNFFPVGGRVYMVEFEGARTGRASLCTVLAQDGHLHTLERRVGWSKDAPEDLEEFSYKVATNVEYPVLRADSIV